MTRLLFGILLLFWISLLFLFFSVCCFDDRHFKEQIHKLLLLCVIFYFVELLFQLIDVLFSKYKLSAVRDAGHVVVEHILDFTLGFFILGVKEVLDLFWEKRCNQVVHSITRTFTTFVLRSDTFCFFLQFLTNFGQNAIRFIIIRVNSSICPSAVSVTTSSNLYNI